MIGQRPLCPYKKLIHVDAPSMPIPTSRRMIKYVVVTGGVISGVGKGIIASSTGVLLKSLGMRVSAIKIDPYLNIDAGTLSPYDHGFTRVRVIVSNDL